jgi:hypothetical protein
MIHLRQRVIPLVVLSAALSVACSSSKSSDRASRYLFVWAGPHSSDTSPAMSNARGVNDFLTVLDADATSPTYGKTLATQDVGTPGMMAHHMELSLPVGHPVFASDYMTGQIFLIDVDNPLAPRVARRIDSVPGFRSPHSFARLQNGNVIVAMQFGNKTVAGDPGGLVEFDATGDFIRATSAADSAFRGARIRPNGIELMPAIDRIVTTSMPMDDERTADVIQVWQLSGLRLLHTLAMPIPAGDTGSVLPYDARVLADGRTAMVDTYYCRLYRVTDVASDQPRIELVHTLEHVRREGCAVAVAAGHYWVVPVAYGRAIVSLDVSDPAHPVEVSTLRTDSTFFPHWLSVDPGSDRIVINSADDGESRVLIAHLNRATGQLSWDDRFQDAGSSRRGVSVDGASTRGKVMAHAAVFGPRR